MVFYKLSAEAASDLFEIYYWGVVEYGREQADAYYEALLRRLTEIADNPHHYSIVEGLEGDYRRSVFRGKSIYYRIARNKVEIMAIIGRQNFDGG